MAKTGHPNVVIDHGTNWRGKAHRWSTVYNLSGSTPNTADQISMMDALVDIENQILWGGGPNLAGFLEARFYTGQGGAPTTVIPFGDIDTPSGWTAYSGTGWSTGPAFGEAGAAESCLIVETKLNGLSSTGKPVYLRKYLHAVPAFPAAAIGSQQIPSADITSLNAYVKKWTDGSLTNGVVVIGPSGRQAASAPSVQSALGNHQMPRGRRQKKASSGGLLSGLISDAQHLATLASSLEDAVL